VWLGCCLRGPFLTADYFFFGALLSSLYEHRLSAANGLLNGLSVFGQGGGTGGGGYAALNGALCVSMRVCVCVCVRTSVCVCVHVCMCACSVYECIV